MILGQVVYFNREKVLDAKQKTADHIYYGFDTAWSVLKPFPLQDNDFSIQFWPEN